MQYSFKNRGPYAERTSVARTPRFRAPDAPCRVSTKEIWKPSSTQLRLKPSILSISGLSPPGTSIGE